MFDLASKGNPQLNFGHTRTIQSLRYISSPPESGGLEIILTIAASVAASELLKAPTVAWQAKQTMCLLSVKLCYQMTTPLPLLDS